MIVDAYGRQVDPLIGVSRRMMGRYLEGEATRAAEVAAAARVEELRRSVLGPDASTFRVGDTVTVRIPRRFEPKQVSGTAPISTCPNGHGPMRRCVGELSPGGPVGESWECDSCGIQCMWPDRD